MVYIGIDIAKFKHFASVVSSDGKVIVKPFPFENSRQGFMKLIEEIENFQDCLIGLESTGHYAENLIQFLYERNYKVAVINPNKLPRRKHRGILVCLRSLKYCYLRPI